MLVARPHDPCNTAGENLLSAEDTTDTSAATGGGQIIGAPPAPFDPLVCVGDVVLASTLITNDTPGPVVAQIRSAPFKGARLLGRFQNNLNNSHLLVQFNAMVLPDGTEVPVSAYAVDARRKSLAVRTHLDRRLFARYVTLRRLSRALARRYPIPERL